MKVPYLFLNFLVGFVSSSSSPKECTSAGDYLKSRRQAYRCRVRAMVSGGTGASRCADLACTVPTAYQHLVPSSGVATAPDPTLFATTIAIVIMVYNYASPFMPWIIVLVSQFGKLKAESVIDLRVKKLGDQLTALNDQVQGLTTIEHRLENVVKTMGTIMTGVGAVKADANRRADMADQKTIQLQVSHERQQMVLQEVRQYLLDMEESIKEQVFHLNASTTLKMHELQKKTNATTTKAISSLATASKGTVKRVPVSPWDAVATISLAIIAFSAVLVAVFHTWLYWPGPNPPNYNQAVAYNGNNVEMVGVGGGAQ